MRHIAIIAAGTLFAFGCGGDKKKPAEPEAKQEAPAEPAPAEKVAEAAPPKAPAPAPEPPKPPEKHLYMDIHELGKVKAKDVAEAHKKDLATQSKFGVEFKAYWVDEKNGKVYCLSEAPSAEAVTNTHKEAHGLMPKQTLEVIADNTDWKPDPKAKLWMDVHNLGPGKVTPEALADAHKKDLAVESKNKVKFINYFLNQETGTVMCLAEAPSAAATSKTHKAAHGLVADHVDQVTEGR